MKIGSKIIYVFENPETFDKYTIILPDGDLLGASDNPFHPCGFGQYSGNLVDNKMFVSYGYSWRKVCNKKEQQKIERVEIKAYLEEARSTKFLGREVKKVDDLPEKVIQFIKERI